ncbi:MAG: DUF4175 family protein [Pseudomonadota bacterium]
MMNTQQTKTLSRKLERKIAVSRLFATTERFARSFWLAAVVLLATAGLLVLFRTILDSTSLTLIAAIGIILSAIIVFFRRSTFEWPSRQDAIARLDGRFDHTPLAALDDDLPANASEETRALWALHKDRAAEAAVQAKATAPHIRLARQDRFALRMVTALAFVMALVFGQSAVQAIITTEGPAGTGPIATGPSFEGWIEPPAYTGQPTYYLTETSDRQLIVPRGSEVIFRVYGQADRARFSETVSGVGSTPLVSENAAFGEAVFIIDGEGLITLDLPRQDAVTWQIALSLDEPPSVRFDGELERTVDGLLQLPFVAEDDFGVLSGTARITLDLDRVDRRYGRAADPETTEPLIFDLPVALVRDPTEIEGVLSENLARHPWANLPVQIELSVFDGADQSGSASLADIDLPGKRFFDPLAAGLVDLRADLLWNRENTPRVARLIRAVTWQPEELFTEDKAYLMVRSALRVLERDLETPDDEAIAEVEDLLWQAALLIEEGDLNDAAERLRRAQERLSEAMRRGASPDEIAELIQELREAMQDYMNALAQNAEPQDPDQQQSQNMQSMSQDQLQQMMDRIQELMEEGRMEEAQALLDQLMQMMENMRVVQGGEGQSGQQQGQQGQQQQMQDMLQEQQDLADDTFEQLQQQFSQQGQQGQQGQQQQGQQGQQQGQQPGQQQGQQQGQGQQPGQQPGQQQGQGQQLGQQQGNGQGSSQQQLGQGQGGNLPSPGELAQRQEALRQLLDQQGQQFGNGPGGQSMEDAERSMGEAADDLAEGDLRGALDNQADAMEALRQGMNEINEAQRQAAQAGQQQGGTDEGFGDDVGQGNERDPLGRSTNSDGNFDTRFGADLESRREFYRDLDAEIRRRLGDQTRPETERDYLRRLLDRF